VEEPFPTVWSIDNGLSRVAEMLKAPSPGALQARVELVLR
jgi:hypothetical protein